VVVDATLLIDVIRGQSAATQFTRVLGRAEVTSVNFGEVLYKLGMVDSLTREEVEAVLTAMGLSVVDVNVGVSRRFLELKQIDERSRAAQRRAGAASRKSLSLADIVCLGYAAETGYPVLTADRHWTTLGKHGLTVAVFDYRNPKTTL
jgi:PIN domain nuclease of toxin-antitoxin system